MRRRLCALALGLAAAAGAGCGPTAPVEIGTGEIFGKFEAAFGRGEAGALEGLYPFDWALVALAGEPRRSLEGRELRRQLMGLFRRRVPVGWRELPGSIRFSPDRGYLVFVGEWTSLALGTDRLVVERLRVGLERNAGEERRGLPGPLETVSSTWQIRELTIWTR